MTTTFILRDAAGQVLLDSADEAAIAELARSRWPALVAYPMFEVIGMRCLAIWETREAYVGWFGSMFIEPQPVAIVEGHGDAQPFSIDLWMPGLEAPIAEMLRLAARDAGNN